MNTEIINSLYNFLPEITLAIAIQVILILSIIGIKNRKFNCAVLVSGISIALILTIFKVFEAPLLLFQGALIHDPFSSIASILILASTLIIVLLFLDPNTDIAEHVLALLIPLAGMLAVSSANLLLTFVSLESISIAVYILVSNQKKIALKYYIYGITSSALMLYGISMIYGMSGSLDYLSISSFMSIDQVNMLTLSIGILFITAGFGFKLLIVPFNFLFPAISEKLSLKVLGLISIPVIITVILTTARFYLTIFHDTNSYLADESVYKLIPGVNWQLFLAILSVCSIIAGNFTVLWIDNLKKFFAFLLIGQSGLLLAGLAASSPEGTTALIYSTIVFVFNFTGLILCLRFIESKFSVYEISSFKGKSLGKENILLFIPFLIFMISIAGVPPLVGFTGKLLIYSSLASSGFGWLVLLSILSSLVLMYRIYSIGNNIFSGKSIGNRAKIETFYRIMLLILILPAILFGVYAQPLLEWSKYATRIIGL
ncbi:MAG: hypothetical protein IT281_09700 [Ignavibacteria bacterium]|nr:hypothetical protein [Ignavibacteria bacterium]